LILPAVIWRNLETKVRGGAIERWSGQIMSTQELCLQPGFGERTKANDVPVGRLVGFEAKDIADGRATVVLAVTTTLESYGDIARRDSLRHC
jgi:hypothetical protein